MQKTMHSITGGIRRYHKHDKNRTVNYYYACYQKVWQKIRDCIAGWERIKERSLQQNTHYLKENNPELKAITTFDQYIRPTDSMRRLGEMGYQRFCDYIYRAMYYNFPAEVSTQSLGLIETEPPVIELPSELESMRSNATITSESLVKVISIMNTEQIEMGRVGLLLEPSADGLTPYNIGVYLAEAILDWNKIVLDDSNEIYDWYKLATDEYDDDEKQIFIILRLVDGVYTQYKTTNLNSNYETTLAEDDGYIEGSLVSPQMAESTIDTIPFVIVNVCGLGADIERPYIESVADAALSLYRASAHLEDAIHWGGESTSFTKGYGLGEDQNIYMGNGAVNKSNLEYADAKFVTMGVDGIAPRQQNHDRLYEHCVSLGVDLLNKGPESGVALKVRSNVRTASLKNLSITGALGLQTLLRVGARWMGTDDTSVVIKANTTFADIRYSADDFVKMATMLDMGSMRYRDMYNLQVKNNITSAETFEEWENDLPEKEEPPPPVDLTPNNSMENP